ncbi:nudC domain-containing protein 3 [Megalopta genalis]|uniref:nudC domain-containing protein 3 n=1 Tax=Megalopta genalis TaxID=115081 RepID=UPI001442F222|nr:nudC domain-containing protein 3 [Megalopta genalis]
MSLDYDPALLKIFLKEKTNFFDTIFGFLHRNTDFYDEYGPDTKSGLSPGEAEKVVLNSFRKWKNTPKFQYQNTDPPKNHNSNVQIAERTEDEAMIIAEETGLRVVEEVEVETSVEPQIIEKQIHSEDKDRISDSYNGAVRENYTWSQSINDLDVLVKLPSSIKTAKDLKVNLDSIHIKIEAKTSTLAQHQEQECSNSDWTIIFIGELCHKTRKDESVWSVVSGKHISIHLEKASERWWEALIVGEPKIELNKIDCSRNLDDMGSEEQMKVQELMWNHQQKLLGKPTSEEIRMEKILKKAWNAKGSPFEGTPYDPSILKFSN